MDYFATLERWHELAQTIRHLQAEERALREGLFAGTFPSPTEGTNTFELPDGRILKGVLKLNRKLNNDELDALVKAKRISKKVADEVRRVKYELNLAGYRDLPSEVRLLVDGALIITSGLPSLELKNGDHDNHD